MGKTLWSIILTILAALIIAFIALLIFDLAQQIYGFVYSLYNEEKNSSQENLRTITFLIIILKMNELFLSTFYSHFHHAKHCSI